MIDIKLNYNKLNYNYIHIILQKKTNNKIKN
jgi:hypothetical protein